MKLSPTEQKQRRMIAEAVRLAEKPAFGFAAGCYPDRCVSQLAMMWFFRERLCPFWRVYGH